MKLPAHPVVRMAFELVTVFLLLVFAQLGYRALSHGGYFSLK